MRRPRALIAAALLAALALSSSAGASVEIRGLDTSGYPAVRLTVVSSQPIAIKPALAEGGRVVTGLEAENLGREKAVVLALDRSQSMTGGALADAVAAARAFVNSKAANDRLGLIAFGEKANEQSALSSSTGELATSLDAMQVDTSRGTALYDAVAQAAHALRSDPLAGRVIVLLTDGKNVGSGTTLEEAVIAAQKAGAVVYAVGIKGPQFDPAPLETLARETGGRYVLASSSTRLSAIYTAVASELSRSWRVSYITAARPGDQVSLQASLVGAGSASTRLRVASVESTSAHTFLPSFLFSTAGTILIALLVGALGLAAIANLSSARKGSWVQARLAPHVGEGTSKEESGSARAPERGRRGLQCHRERVRQPERLATAHAACSSAPTCRSRRSSSSGRYLAGHRVRPGRLADRRRLLGGSGRDAYRRRRFLTFTSGAGCAGDSPPSRRSCPTCWRRWPHRSRPVTVSSRA